MLKQVIILFAASASLIFCQINRDSANRFLLAQSYAQSGDYEKAKNIFAELYNSNPTNPQYFQALNDVLLQMKEYDSSINLIQQKISNSPQDINLYGLLGSVYYLMGDEKKGSSIWDEGLSKADQNPVFYRVIANYATERRAFDKAIEVMEKGKKISKDPNMFSYDLANLYSLTMRFKESAEEYCSILSNNPNQLNAVEARIFSYIGKPGALGETIKVFEDCKADDNISYYYLLARLYTEDKNYESARELYAEVDKRQGSQGAELFNFAQMLFYEQEYEIASSVFNEIIKRYPASPFISNAKLGYAKTMEEVLSKKFTSQIAAWKPYYKIKPLASEIVNEVVDAYEQVIKLFPHSEAANEASVRIGKLKFEKEAKPEEAKKYFQSVVENSPLSVFAADALTGLAEIAIIEGNLDEAENYLSKIIENSRTLPDKVNSARLKLADINFYNGEFNKAKKNLSEIINNLKDNNANDAIELSLLLNTTMNDSANLLIFAEAELLAEQKKFEQAAEKYELVAQNPKGFVLAHLAKIRAAEMKLALDEIETSVNLLSLITAENEKNIYADKALYLLGKIYQYGKNDVQKAIEVYESLLAKFPNSLYLDEARDEIIKLRNKLS